MHERKGKEWFLFSKKSWNVQVLKGLKVDLLSKESSHEDPFLKPKRTLHISWSSSNFPVK